MSLLIHCYIYYHTWTDQSKNPVSEIKLCKVGERTRSCDGAVILTFTVKSDRCWTLNVHGNCVTPSNCSAIKHFSQLVTTVDSLNEMLCCLDKLNVCPAHPEERFVQMAKAKKGFRDGKVSAVVDDSADVNLNGDNYCCTVRTKSCEMLVPSVKCSKCVSYRPSLRTMYSRWEKSVLSSPTKHTASSSRTNVRYLSTPLGRKRYQSLRARITSTERKLERLLHKIEASTESKGVVVDDDLPTSRSVEEQTPSIHEQYPEGSFKRLFWEQQKLN